MLEAKFITSLVSEMEPCWYAEPLTWQDLKFLKARNSTRNKN